MASMARVHLDCPVSPAVQVALPRRRTGRADQATALCPSCGARVELLVGPDGYRLVPPRRYAPPSRHQVLADDPFRQLH